MKTVKMKINGDRRPANEASMPMRMTALMTLRKVMMQMVPATWLAMMLLMTTRMLPITTMVAASCGASGDEVEEKPGGRSFPIEYPHMGPDVLYWTRTKRRTFGRS